MLCFVCNKAYEANAKCSKGHFVCDKCHSLSANELISEFCINTNLEDPLEIALILMRNAKVKMHGPEHHFLVPAVLLSAYYNIKKEKEKKQGKIKEAEKRAKNVLGGFCGFYGACGSSIGTGIFISIITNATPLTSNEMRLANLMTSKSLNSVSCVTGARCCKRNSFLSIIEAINFLKENFGLFINYSAINCEFSSLNKECIKSECPFWI